MFTERVNKMSDKAKEITIEYRKCCIELELNPNYIHDDISEAPNYPTYFNKCKEYTVLARTKLAREA